MSEIRKWLELIDLGQYADAFEANAVCLLPGTELAFDENVKCRPLFDIDFLPSKKIGQRLALFRQINAESSVTHLGALEFPDGQVVLLTRLCEGQRATVLQLPAAAHTVLAREGRAVRPRSVLT